MADADKRPARYTPDRRKGGMSEAEKGKGKIHLLHEGEIVLNRPTTKKLLCSCDMGLSSECEKIPLNFPNPPLEKGENLRQFGGKYEHRGT